MINTAVLVGRLTKDIEIRKTSNGKSVTSFTVAVQRDRDTADFVPCVAWNKTAELLAQYCRKGSQVGLNGSIRTRSYDDPNYHDKKVYVTEVLVDNITFLSPRSEESQTTFTPVDETVIEISSDDLPF